MRPALLLLLLLGGCAGHTERAAESRDYDRLDFRVRFVEYRQRCYDVGGQIYIRAAGNLDRDGVPPRGSHYRCARRR